MAVHEDTGASGSPPPSPPTPHRNSTPTLTPDSSPDRMPPLRDRAVFFHKLHLIVKIKQNSYTSTKF